MDTEYKSERKFVTILFADIVNFTRFSESHDPEIVTELLEKFLKIGTNIVIKRGGFVDKYVGDCIMALFGAPITKENDPKNAIMAAMEIMEEIQNLNATLTYPLSIRIGIHTGLVIAGYIGPKKNRQYTVIGHAVNVAKRIQEEGKSDKIYVSESTYGATKDSFIFQSSDSRLFKGLSKPIKIFEVLGIQKNIIREVPFIGRKKYLTKLIRLSDKAAKGKLQILSIVGERGAGKSKLIEQFKDYLSDKNVTLRYGMGINTQKFIPYSGIINILKINLGIQDLQNKRKVNKILKERLTKFERYYMSILLSTSSTKEYMQSKVLNNGIYTSLKSMVMRLAEKDTLIMIIDDADYIDSQSLEILTRLLNEIKNIKAFFVITSTTRLLEFGQLIQLKPFSLKETQKFIRNVSPKKLSPELVNYIYKITKGNPLFIEEILRDPSLDANRVSVPFSLHESIMARVDKLHASSKKLLQYASVLGYMGNINILQNISNFSDNKFNSSMEDLVLSGFIKRISDNQYIYLHPLVHEIIYNSLLIKTRKILHNEIGRIIEKKYTSNINDYYEILAYHFESGGDKNKSLYYHIQSADKALSLYNTKSAIDFYKKALNIAKSIKDEKDINYITLKIGEAYYAKGNFNTSLTWYKKILNNKKLEGSIIYYKSLLGIADNLERKGKYEKAISLSTDILQSVKENNIIKAKALLLLSISHFRLANYETSLDYAFKSQDIAMKLGSLEDVAGANAFIGHSYRFLGDFDSSEKYHRKNIEIGELTSNLLRIAYTYDSLASIYRDRGDYKSAMKYLQESLAILIKMGQTLNIGDVYSDIAEVYLLLKDYNNSYKYLKMAKKIFKKIGYVYEQIILNRRFANYYLQLGKYIRSAKYAREALNLAKKSGEKLEEGRVYLLLGDIYNNIGKNKLAMDKIAKAIDIFKKSNARFYLEQAKNTLLKIKESSTAKV